MQNKIHLALIPAVLVVLIFGLWGSCSNRTVGPDTSFPEEGFYISGALNKVFHEQYVGSFLTTDDPSVLGLKIFSKIKGRDQTERASLNLRITLPRGETAWREREYTFKNGSIENHGEFEGSFSYRISEDTHSEEYHVFDFTALVLKIEKIDGERIVGKYSIQGSHTSGERIDNGRSKPVTIGGDGRITILGAFNVFLMIDP